MTRVRNPESEYQMRTSENGVFIFRPQKKSTVVRRVNPHFFFFFFVGSKNQKEKKKRTNSQGNEENMKPSPSKASVVIYPGA